MLLAELASLAASALSEAKSRPGSFCAALLASGFFAYVVVNEVICFKARIPGFPGPSRLPLVGNLHQVRSNAAEKYRQWAKKYGPVYQIQMGNIPVLLVNSAAAAKTIFGTNSGSVASRPELYTFHKVVSNTAGTTIGTSPYSESLKRRRKGAASALNRPSVETYIPSIDLETREFVSAALIHGKAGQSAIDPVPLVQRLSLSLALTLNWGMRIKSHEDDLLREIIHVEIEISRFRSTTDNLQDYIPLLRLNPFSSDQKKAVEYRQRRDNYLSKLNRELEEKVEKGTHKPCIQANVMLDNEAKLNDVELMSISLTMLSGGFETFSAVTSWSIAYLSNHPEIQEKAIQAIREKFGKDRPLCEAYDDQGCDYIRGLVRECLRYFTILRLSLPRSTNKDFVYDGRVVPAGTMVFLNAWACNMDDELWEDPEVFRPERWIEHPNHPIFTFGVGYRMCAASLLAYRELYLTFIRMISAFEILPVGTVDTDPVTGVADLTNLSSTPKDFQVKFMPRNEPLLRAALEEAEKDDSY